MPPSKAGSKAGAAALGFALVSEALSACRSHDMQAQVGALTKAGCSDAELKQVEALTKASRSAN